MWAGKQAETRSGRQRGAAHRARHPGPRRRARASVVCHRGETAGRVQRSASHFSWGCHSGWPRLQAEQGVLEHFGASEEGRQAALPLTQDERPGSDLLGRRSLLRVCAMIRILHAFLVSDGRLAQRGEMRVACHIWTRWARSLPPVRRNSRDYALSTKCHCSARSPPVLIAQPRL